MWKGKVLRMAGLHLQEQLNGTHCDHSFFSHHSVTHSICISNNCGLFASRKSITVKTRIESFTLSIYLTIDATPTLDLISITQISFDLPFISLSCGAPLHCLHIAYWLETECSQIWGFLLPYKHQMITRAAYGRDRFAP